METSFLELKSKQVINTVDGKCLGHITDIIFDVATSRACGFIVPEIRSGFMSLFRSCKNIFIPFDCVCKIGVDVILVEIYIEAKSSECKNTKQRVDCNNDLPYNVKKDCK